MSHRNQSGFILMAVAIIVTIGLLGLVGWSLYSHYYGNQNSVTTTGGQNPKPPISNPSNSTTTPQPTYLDIKELGIQIKVDDSIKDAVYSYSAASSPQYPQYIGGVNISTQSLISKDTACDPAKGGNPLGSINKLSTDQDGRGNTLVPNGSTVFKLGGNYYILTTPQSPCSTDPTAINLQIQQRTTFFNDFKTVQLYSATLDIKELGIKITLNDQIDDAVYALVKNQPANGSTLIGISAQSLVDNETNHKDQCIAAGAPLGSISASTTQPAYIGGAYPVDNKTLFKFGDTYYQYIHPQGTIMCGVTPSGYEDSAIASKMSAFQQAFTTAQPDK